MQFQIQKDIQDIKNSALQQFFPWRGQRHLHHLPAVAHINEQFFWLDSFNEYPNTILVLQSSLDELIVHLLELYTWDELLVPQDLFSIRKLIEEFDLEWEALYEYFGEGLRRLTSKWGFILELPEKYQNLVISGVIEPGLLNYMLNNGFRWRDCYAEILAEFHLSSSQQRDMVESLGRYLRREGFDSETFKARYNDVLESFQGDRRELMDFLHTLCSPKLIEYRAEREKLIKTLQQKLQANQIDWDRSLESNDLRVNWNIKTLEDFKNLKKVLQSRDLDLAVEEILEN